MTTTTPEEPQIVLYDLKELRASAEYERQNNVIGKERIDRLEIEKLFQSRLKKKAVRSGEKKTFNELIHNVDLRFLKSIE
jgi:hypothetical protein